MEEKTKGCGDYSEVIDVRVVGGLCSPPPSQTRTSGFPASGSSGLFLA